MFTMIFRWGTPPSLAASGGIEAHSRAPSRCSNLEVDKFPSEGLVMAHTVFCVKLKRELPGLDEPPFDNDLGRKVYDNVSQEAWRMWTEHCKMLLNEYRLNPARPHHHEHIVNNIHHSYSV